MYTIKEVANILRMHPITIYKYCEKGKIKGVKIGNVWRVSQKEIERLLGV